METQEQLDSFATPLNKAAFVHGSRCGWSMARRVAADGWRFPVDEGDSSIAGGMATALGVRISLSHQHHP